MAAASTHPAIIVPTRRPLLQRWRDNLQSLWQGWRERERERQALRALESLSDRTLRDIGMAERVPPHPSTLGVMDHERGRWS